VAATRYNTSIWWHTDPNGRQLALERDRIGTETEIGQLFPRSSRFRSKPNYFDLPSAHRAEFRIGNLWDTYEDHIAFRFSLIVYGAATKMSTTLYFGSCCNFTESLNFILFLLLVTVVAR